jgi:hypothetical protein
MKNVWYTMQELEDQEFPKTRGEFKAKANFY